jgi:hypothetical protein
MCSLFAQRSVERPEHITMIGEGLEQVVHRVDID